MVAVFEIAVFIKTVILIHNCVGASNGIAVSLSVKMDNSCRERERERERGGEREIVWISTDTSSINKFWAKITVVS